MKPRPVRRPQRAPFTRAGVVSFLERSAGLPIVRVCQFLPDSAHPKKPQRPQLSPVLGPFLDDAMPQDPFVREKFTRERTAAKKLAAEYFQRLPDRSRELAPSAIAKHRVRDEAAARADRRRRLNMKESASVGGLYSLRSLLTLLMIGHIPILARHLR